MTVKIDEDLCGNCYYYSKKIELCIYGDGCNPIYFEEIKGESDE